MRNKFFVVLGVAGTLTLAACSSSVEEKPATQANAVSPSNSQVVTAVANSAPANTATVTNGYVVTPQVADANVATSDPGAAVQSPHLQNRLEKMRASGGSGPDVDPVELAMKNARPAPDNSTFTSYLSDAGYEIRTFTGHPKLKKVEKRTTNEANITIKVTLTDGRVVDVPAQKIPVLATAPASQIMEAAGLSTSTVRSAPGGTGAKKAN